MDAYHTKQEDNAYSLDAVINAINEEQLQTQLNDEDNGTPLNKTISVYKNQFSERSLQDEGF